MGSKCLSNSKSWKADTSSKKRNNFSAVYLRQTKSCRYRLILNIKTNGPKEATASENIGKLFSVPKKGSCKLF